MSSAAVSAAVTVVGEVIDGRKRYPSDLSDEQWELIAELIPPQRLTRRGGRPREVDMREVINAILYQCRSGCQWHPGGTRLPHDLLPKSTVWEYFAKWRDDGTLKQINMILVGAVRSIHAPSGQADPSAGSVDSQTVKTSERSSSRGYDGGKKLTGRKRNIAVDTLGLLLAVSVTIASMEDAYAIKPVLQQLTVADAEALADELLAIKPTPAWLLALPGSAAGNAETGLAAKRTSWPLSSMSQPAFTSGPTSP